MNLSNIKSSLFLILLGLSIQGVYAQSSYVPFPEGDAVWHVGIKSQYVIVPTHDQYMYAGDTMINQIIYHKISYKEEYIHLPDGNLVVYDQGIVGYLRQDTALRQVYLIPASDGQEYLLYDFNVMVGDTYPLTYSLLSWGELTVIAKDSILIGNSFRPLFILLAPYGGMSDTFKIIEGIGWSSGLVTEAPTFCGEICMRLTCFQDDGETVYSSDEDTFGGGLPFGFCHIVGLGEIPNQKGDFSLQPDPVIKGNEVSLSRNSSEPMKVFVYDLFGNLKWVNQFNPEAKMIIPTYNLPSGIYTVKVTDDHTFSTQKLVVD